MYLYVKFREGTDMASARKAVVMALSTAWKLRRIMRTNPAEAIKNE